MISKILAVLCSLATTATVSSTSKEVNKIKVPEEPTSAFVETVKEPETETQKSVVVVSKTKRKYFDVPLSQHEQDIIYTYSVLYGLDPSLVFAVIDQESSFDKYATSSSSYGLMQINKCNWSKYNLTVANVYSVNSNVRAGCIHLSDLYKKYGNVSQALIAYNEGEAGAKELYFNKGIYSNSYSQKVISKTEKYK